MKKIMLALSSMLLLAACGTTGSGSVTYVPNDPPPNFGVHHHSHGLHHHK
jgi:hypothetical protein